MNCPYLPVLSQLIPPIKQRILIKDELVMCFETISGSRDIKRNIPTAASINKGSSNDWDTC